MRFGEISVNSTDPVVKQQTTAQTKAEKPEEEVVVIETDEKKENDLTSPVEGYHIEKTDVQPDDDDEDDAIDTNVNPEQRITLNPSIALNNASNQLTDALDQAVDRASNTGLENDNITDRFFAQAQNMQIKDNPYPFFDKKIGTKRSNIFGKAVYEGLNYNYADDDVNITMGQQSLRLQAGGVFSSKSDRTKFAFFATGTNTGTNMDYHEGDSHYNVDMSNGEISSADSDSDNQSDHSTVQSYSAYLAARHTFNNGDVISGSAIHISDGIQDSKTTTISGDYYLSKYSAAIRANVDIYKQGENVSTTKTNFSCYFNPENGETTSVDDAAPKKEIERVSNLITKPADKKWKFSMSPFFDTNAIEGSPEEGLGLQARLKRKTTDSTTVVRAFGKGSTTQDKDDNLYHVTFGSSLTYKKNVGAHSLLRADVDVKDKYTFSQGNILTASGNLSYVAPKVTAELEGKFIKVPNSTYKGLAARVSYTPSDNVHLYGEGGLIDWQYPEGRLKGGSVQFGALVNF
ncbi:hypothetical protein J6O48_00615 [bacterium]|nr:hypothetical protein [bacterium]